MQEFKPLTYRGIVGSHIKLLNDIRLGSVVNDDVVSRIDIKLCDLVEPFLDQVHLAMFP